MAKSDFNVEEQEYDVVYDEEEKKGSFFSRKNKRKEEGNDENNNDITNNTEKSDFVTTDNGTVLENADVVYDDSSSVSFSDNLKNFFSTINARALIVIFGIFLVIFVIVLLIVVNIAKVNASYVANVIVPQTVYMGETSSISVIAKGDGKKSLDDVITTFKPKTDKSFSVVEEEMKGKEIMNTIVPIQEGRDKLSVVSKLGNKTLANVTKTVVVCPKFSTDLLLTKNISIVKGSTFDLGIDFGEEECSKGIVYESSDENIFTVTEDGSLTGVNTGRAILTIRRGIKSMSVKVDITEKNIQLTSFKVIPNVVQLSPGEKFRLKVDYAPVNATSSDISFASDNEDVVKVSKGGLLEAVSPGEATIRVSMTYDFQVEVKVYVSDKSNNDSYVTEMNLDKKEINLVQGKSEKVLATVTPNDASNKNIKWKSSNEKVATVNSNGVIYGKGVGTCDIVASTDNNISRTVKVTVVKMRNPVITSSDGIATNQWHNKPYVLNFSGSENGAIYYYGNTEDSMNSTGGKVTISKDESVTYYVKGCTTACQEKCSIKKDKNNNIVKDKDGNAVNVCTSDCNDKPTTCSDVVSYISKLDVTKPQIVTVAGIEQRPVKTDTVQIAIRDYTSLVQKWCVIDRDNSSLCRWNTIETNAKPVVNYTATVNGTYYVFAKDTAGNISNGYKFEIVNIE